jgi:hypothetical protein
MQQSDTGSGDTPTFVDDTQRQWEVREICEPILPDRTSLLAPSEFSAGWLLFTSGAERRRLAPLPPGWRQAPEAQLRRWCEDACPARNTS